MKVPTPAITPENIMKAEVIHPEWNRYDFDLADKPLELPYTSFL